MQCIYICACCICLDDADSSAQESFFSSWGLTSLSNAVTSKGLQMVSEGIDALETIGKKTMDVISEGDPGFREKRGMFNKPSLSQVFFKFIFNEDK